MTTFEQTFSACRAFAASKLSRLPVPSMTVAEARTTAHALRCGPLPADVDGAHRAVAETFRFADLAVLAVAGEPARVLWVDSGDPGIKAERISGFKPGVVPELPDLDGLRRAAEWVVRGTDPDDMAVAGDLFALATWREGVWSDAPAPTDVTEPDPPCPGCGRAFSGGVIAPTGEAICSECADLALEHRDECETCGECGHLVSTGIIAATVGGPFHHRRGLVCVECGDSPVRCLACAGQHEQIHLVRVENAVQEGE